MQPETIYPCTILSAHKRKPLKHNTPKDNNHLYLSYQANSPGNSRMATNITKARAVMPPIMMESIHLNPVSYSPLYHNAAIR